MEKQSKVPQKKNPLKEESKQEEIQTMIDTKAKVGKQKKVKTLGGAGQQQDEADLLIQKIINDDIDLDEHISAFDLINQFKRYEQSLKKFGVSEDTLFEKLSIKNKQIERFEMNQKTIQAIAEVNEEEKAEQLEEGTFLIETSKKPNLVKGLPVEIIMEVFKMLDVRTFMIRVPYVCKEWGDIIQSERTKKQAGKLFKAHCFNIWGNSLQDGGLGLYQANAKFLTKFGNWRNMLKHRPLLRFDGFYICKMMYRRQGLSINSLNSPIHEVIWYRYIRFLPDRTAVSLYTNATPKRFLPKYTQSLHLHSQTDSMTSAALQASQDEPSLPLPTNAPQITLQTGTYSIHNEFLTLMLNVGTTEYRYEFQMFRNNALPEYQRECDYIDMYWAGFKVGEGDVVGPRMAVTYDDLQQQYLQIKVNNYNENKFMFRRVADLDYYL
ncbi:hypothetical protein FGO68_gene10620 [Halteria grandinella]|uniref:F-box domain-containing protein n=1 Tax=Halteria grandinella TaxID=5974 RepID=A0A8J8P5G0_HALGN|nr:hypothetical protein FGO68_gene10620 [Halteria grandinella]